MKKVILILLLGMFLINFISATYCYQEFANQTSVCGGLSTGKYVFDAGWTNPNSAIDGNWGTLGFSGGGNLYINYTIPTTDTIEAIWQKKDNDGVQNHSVNQTCLFYDNSTLQLRVYSQSPNNVSWYCYNGDWKRISFQEIGGAVYEEGIYWEFTPPIVTTNGEYYENPVVEGGETTFYLNITSDVLPYPNKTLIKATFNYNGTNYDATINPSGDFYQLSKTLNAPRIDISLNMSFYWNISLIGGEEIMATKNQTILNLQADNCSVGSYLLYNFSVVDEKTQIKIPPVTSKVNGLLNLQIYDASGNLITEYSNKYVNLSDFLVCINDDLTSRNLILNAQVQYYAENYSSEFYHLQHVELTENSFATNITLYDLDSDSTQEFKITYKDENYFPIEGALIQIQRKYVGEGLYKTIEIPKTSSQGETLANLELSDTIYNFIIVKDGEVLATFEQSSVSCQSLALGQCEINLNSYSSGISPKDFTTLDDFSFLFSWNKSSRDIATLFTIPSGDTSTINLNVTKYDSFGNNSLCSISIVSSSGYINCSVPATYGNTTIVAKLTKDGELMSTIYVTLGNDPTDIYGSSIVFIALFLLLTILGIGVTDNPIITGVLLVVGLVLLVSMNIISTAGYIGYGATILWFIIAVIVILIKGVKR